MSKLDKLASYVRSHGFTPRVHDGAVMFEVPFVNVLDGTNGVELFIVSTIAEAREALGY